MTVDELIERLKKMPPDAQVVVLGDCGCGSYGGEKNISVSICNCNSIYDGKVIVCGYE